MNLWQLLFILYEIACGLHRFYQVAKLGKFKAAFFFVKIEADLCNIRINTIAFFLKILKLSAIKIYFDKARYLQVSNVALAYFELAQGLQVLIFNFAVWADDCTVDCLSETLVFHLGALLFL